MATDLDLQLKPNFATSSLGAKLGKISTFRGKFPGECLVHHLVMDEQFSSIEQ